MGAEQLGLFWQPLADDKCVRFVSKSSSAIRRIVGSLIPTIDANFRRLPWIIRNQHLNPFNDCGDPRDAFFLADILESSLNCFKTIYFATTS